MIPGEAVNLKRGRGRPSLVDEQAVERLLSFSRRFVEMELKAENLPLEVRFEAALRLVVKSIPQAVTGNLSEQKYVEILHRFEGLDTEALRAISQTCGQRALPEKAA